jgi:FliP family
VASNEEIFYHSGFRRAPGYNSFGASAGPQRTPPAGRRDGRRADRSNCCAPDRVVGRTGAPCHVDELYAIRDRPVIPALGAWAAKHAGQLDSHKPVSFHDVLCDGAYFRQGMGGGVKPLMDNSVTEQEALGKIVEPFREFMMAQVRDKDLKLFEDLARDNFKLKDETKGELRVLIPAFMISELRRGFEIGFLIALPFLVIDMMVSTLTMSMGMMMLPPSVIALPLKILFFILIDGWNLLIGSLVRSYA